MTCPSGTVISKLQDLEILTTMTAPPETICEDFGYNLVIKTCSLAEGAEWLVPEYQQSCLSYNVNKLDDNKTDLIRHWNDTYRRKGHRFIRSQIDEMRTDMVLPTGGFNFIEIDSEIKELSQSNVLFNDVLTTALSEISFLLDKGMDKLNYQIKVKIEEDFEIPEWKETLISIKVPERNPKDLIRLWKLIEERVRKKIESIKKENEEEITKINENIVIVIE